MCRWHCVWTWRRWVGVFPSPWCWMVFRVGWLDMEGLEWADRQPSIECSVASGGSGLVSYVNRRGSWIWEVKGVNFKVLVGIPCSGFGKSIWRLCEKHLINLFKSFCSPRLVLLSDKKKHITEHPDGIIVANCFNVEGQGLGLDSSCSFAYLMELAFSVTYMILLTVALKGAPFFNPDIFF